MTCSRTVSPGHEVDGRRHVRVVARDHVHLARGRPAPGVIGGVGPGGVARGDASASREAERGDEPGDGSRGVGIAPDDAGHAPAPVRARPAHRGLTRQCPRPSVRPPRRGPSRPRGDPVSPRTGPEQEPPASVPTAPAHHEDARAGRPGGDAGRGRPSASRASSSATARSRRSTASTSRSASGEFFSMLGPVGLGQDDDPADDRRVRAAHGGPGRAPRARRDRPRPVRARRQHGVPGLRPVPAHDRRRERRATGSWSARSPSPSATRRVGRGARHGPPRRATRSASPRSSPAASASGSRSRARS